MHVQWRECCRVVSTGVDHEDMLQLLQSFFLGPTIGFSIHLSGSSGSYQVNKVRDCPCGLQGQSDAGVAVDLQCMIKHDVFFRGSAGFHIIVERKSIVFLLPGRVTRVLTDAFSCQAYEFVYTQSCILWCNCNAIQPQQHYMTSSVIEWHSYEQILGQRDTALY